MYIHLCRIHYQFSVGPAVDTLILSMFLPFVKKVQKSRLMLTPTAYTYTDKLTKSQQRSIYTNVKK